MESLELLEKERDRLILAMTEMYVNETKPKIIIGEDGEILCSYEWKNKDIEELFLVMNDYLEIINPMLFRGRNLMMHAALMRMHPRDRLEVLHHSKDLPNEFSYRGVGKEPAIYDKLGAEIYGNKDQPDYGRYYNNPVRER